MATCTKDACTKTEGTSEGLPTFDKRSLSIGKENALPDLLRNIGFIQYCLGSDY